MIQTFDEVGLHFLSELKKREDLCTKRLTPLPTKVHLEVMSGGICLLSGGWALHVRLNSIYGLLRRL